MSSTPDRAKRRSKEQWENLVHECLEGNHKKVKFCKERGLSYSAFMFHCARIRKQSGKERQVTNAPERLIAMKLVTAAEDTSVPPKNPALCSLNLKNGTTLRIYDRDCFNDIVNKLMSHAAVI